MQITITTKKYQAVIEYNDPKNIVLKTGAVLGIESPSLSQSDKIIRALLCTAGTNVTQCDYTFKSASSVASVLVGSPQSGNRFFAKYLGNATPTTNSSNQQSNSGANNPNSTTSSGSAPINNNLTTDAVAKSIITFCKDFSFDINPRIINTMFYIDKKEINGYLVNCMELMGFDESLLELARKKFTSPEWKQIVSNLKNLTPTRPNMNKRLVVFYGPAGTGKTTKAVQEYGILDENGLAKNRVVASASADPDEMFTHFEPTTKRYELSPIGEAMLNGQPIIIDEANFYCSEALSRLQGVTDEQTSLTDNGILIPIKDGFKIIITMNLTTNTGGMRPLSEPLVSRCESIKNYTNEQDLSWVI